MDFSALQIPPPTNWQDFETLCCDLWRAIWKDPNTMRHGRSGQGQQGVDVYGRPEQGTSWAGVQCKGKDNYAEKEITKKELLVEVGKAKSFAPPLSEWIIATSGPKDAAIEQLARELTVEHLRDGLFSVHVWAWRDIVERLADFPEVIDKHYPLLSKNITTRASKQLDEIKENTQGILENSTEINTSLSTLTEELTTTLSQKSRGSAGITSSDIQSVVLTTEYQAEIDYARDLVNSFKYKDCIEYLEKLKGRIWASAQSIIKFRLLSNLGGSQV